VTDTFKGISGAPGTSAGGSYSGGRFSEHYINAPQNDLIELFQDALDPSKGKTKKIILEYLKELLGRHTKTRVPKLLKVCQMVCIISPHYRQKLPLINRDKCVN
jgi:hypothetical protein